MEQALQEIQRILRVREPTGRRAHSDWHQVRLKQVKVIVDDCLTAIANNRLNEPLPPAHPDDIDGSLAKGRIIA